RRFRRRSSATGSATAFPTLDPFARARVRSNFGRRQDDSDPMGVQSMPRTPSRRTFAASVVLGLTATAAGASGAPSPRPRARALGIPFDGTPGRLNALTDVPGVEVGHTTLIRGAGKLVVGKGPVRTGVTAILPRGRKASEPVFASWFSLNGNGE